MSYNQTKYINAAFQGGGAKVMELVAAAHALAEIHEDDRNYPDMKVKSVAGTSAGAIAASLFYTNANFDRVIHKHKEIERVIKTQFPKWKINKGFFILQMLRNKTLFPEKAVSATLEKLFELANVENPKKAIRSFKNNVDKPPRCDNIFILAADLHNDGTGEHDSNSSKGLIEALIDSVGIPLVFRNARSSPNSAHIVDGGIFENLPGLVVAKDIDEDTIPIAFSFEEDDVVNIEKLNSFKYGRYILGKIINKGVNEARYHYKDEAIIKLPNNRSTLEFHSLFNDDFEENYRELKRSIKNKILNVVNKKQLRDIDWNSTKAIDIIRKNREISERAGRFADYSIRSLGYHAKEIIWRTRANSLLDRKTADFLELTIILDGKDNTGLQYMRSVFYDSGKGHMCIPKFQFERRKKRGNWEEIPILFVPLTQENERRALLIVFPKPLQANYIYKFTKTERIYNCYQNYGQNKPDVQALTFRKGRKVDRIKFEMSFPEDCRPRRFNNIDEENDGKLINELFGSAEAKARLTLIKSKSISRPQPKGGWVQFTAAFEKVPEDVENYIAIVYEKSGNFKEW